MATFQAQVHGLTSLTISSSGTSPTEAELTQFLTDGAKEVINLLPPQLKEKCMKITNLYIGNTNTTFDLDDAGEVTYVTRENANSGYYTPCRKIPSMFGDLTNDSGNIIHYATSTDPVYWVESNSSGVATLFVKPTPDANQPAKVYHISYPAVAYGDEVITNFPNEAEYIVVLYAACKALQNSLGAIGISTFSLSASAPADVPSAPSISSPGVGTTTVGSLGTAPEYTPPSITNAADASMGNDTDMDVSEMSTATWTSLDYDFDNENIDFLKWFQVAGDLIQNEEDTELAQAQMQEISTYLSAYGQAMQNKLNVFNDANVEYQATIKKAFQDAQMAAQEANKEGDMTLAASIQDYTLELQRVSNSVSRYQALVQQEVQTYQQELEEKKNEYTWMTQQYQMLKQDYTQGISSLGVAKGQMAGSETR